MRADRGTGLVGDQLRERVREAFVLGRRVEKHPGVSCLVGLRFMEQGSEGSHTSDKRRQVDAALGFELVHLVRLDPELHPFVVAGKVLRAQQGIPERKDMAEICVVMGRCNAVMDLVLGR